MINPSLALNFTTASLDNRVTFTRATGAGNPATYVNSSGLIAAATNNEPRFDYDPVTLACKGLLIEESRTNYVFWSEDLGNASWTKSNSSVTQNATTSPDGNVTADLLYETAVVSTHFAATAQFPVTSGGSYTYSVFAEISGRRYLTLTFDSGSFGPTQYSTFDLQTGTVSGGAAATAKIELSANGFYRCSHTAIATATTATGIAYNLLSNAATGRLPTYLGDGTSGIYVWGAQLEAGASPTSYIPTTTTALTRNADVATITGSNFTSFWNATQGGAQVQATPSTVSGITPLIQYDDGTVNEIIALRGNTTNPELYIVDGGTPQAQLDAGTIAANTAYSLTGWWATNDCRARKDSGAVVTDATATIPTVTQARLGSDGTNYLNGHLATVNYYAAFSSQIYTRRKNKVVFQLL